MVNWLRRGCIKSDSGGGSGGGGALLHHTHIKQM